MGVDVGHFLKSGGGFSTGGCWCLLVFVSGCCCVGVDVGPFFKK